MKLTLTELSRREARDGMWHSERMSNELDDWLAIHHSLSPADEPDVLVAAFPSEEIRMAYLSTAAERSEEEARTLLYSFLGESRSLPEYDRLNLVSLQHRGLSVRGPSTDSGWTPRFTEYERRLITSAAGRSSLPTWEGLTWVLDLLPHSPGVAIDVVHAYTLAHAQVLADVRLSGLSDAIELIRSRYILQGSESIDSLVAMLLTMRSRDFEFLVAHAYRRLGYEVEVTPEQKDRGKDVIARRNGEVVFVECKNWSNRVDASVIAGLTGRVEAARVTRGVVVGTSGFTEIGSATAKEVASDSPWRISLWDGTRLVQTLNEHAGSDWHLRVERIVEGERAAFDSQSQRS